VSGGTIVSVSVFIVGVAEEGRLFEESSCGAPISSAMIVAVRKKKKKEEGRSQTKKREKKKSFK
jgi:hypothetical protein